MSTFSISLSNEQHSADEEFFVLGKITVGDFSENFHASLSYWDRQDYIDQWFSSFNKIISVENNKGAIISSMYNPVSANFIFCWVMYKYNDLIYLQNHILFLDDLPCTFDEKNIEKSIPDRELVTEEGELISEWKIPLTDIIKFVKTLNAH